MTRRQRYVTPVIENLETRQSLTTVYPQIIALEVYLTLFPTPTQEAEPNNWSPPIDIPPIPIGPAGPGAAFSNWSPVDSTA